MVVDVFADILSIIPELHSAAELGKLQVLIPAYKAIEKFTYA